MTKTFKITDVTSKSLIGPRWMLEVFSAGVRDVSFYRSREDAETNAKWMAA